MKRNKELWLIDPELIEYELAGSADLTRVREEVRRRMEKEYGPIGSSISSAPAWYKIYIDALFENTVKETIGAILPSVRLVEISMRRAKLRAFTKDELEKSPDEKLAKSLRRVAGVEQKIYQTRRNPIKGVTKYKPKRLKRKPIAEMSTKEQFHQMKDYMKRLKK